MNALLISTLMLPLAGAIVLLIGRGMFSREAARQIGLLVSIGTLVASLALANRFVQLPADVGPRSPVQPRYSTSYHWLTYADASESVPGRPRLQFDFLLGLDGISLSLILL